MPIVFAVVAAIWLASFLLGPFNGKISDFPQYYAPAKLIVSGRGADTYKMDQVIAMQHTSFPSMAERFVPTYLPPPSLFWFLPFGLLSPQQASIVWKLIQGASLVGSILLLRSSFDLNRKAVGWLIAGICISGPAFAAIQIEQISMLILFAISVLIWALKKDHPIVAAVALSILMLKPQEGLPLLIYLAGSKRWKILGITICILLATTLVVSCLIGTQGLSDYFASTSSAVQKDQSSLMQTELGPTLRGQLLRLAPNSKTPIMIASTLVAMVTWTFIFISGRRFAENKNWIGSMLLIAVPLGLVTSLHLHSYDLTLLVPSLVLVMSGPLESAMPPWFILAGYLLVGMFMVPFYIYIHWDYLLKERWLLNPHFFSLLALSLGLAYLAYRYPTRLEKNTDVEAQPVRSQP